jgi:hypothetical protein
MFDLHTVDDIDLLRESHELECKLAHGQTGQGEIPKDFWPTYSAMANAHGGVVLLGVREKEGHFTVAGLPNATKVRADLFNNLNNPGKVSANLLTDTDVQELVIEGQTILCIRIPQATRKQRPVFLNGQLFGVFSLAQDLLREQPVQATTRHELRQLLANRPSGGIVFATIQKFMPGEDEDNITSVMSPEGAQSAESIQNVRLTTSLLLYTIAIHQSAYGDKHVHRHRFRQQPFPSRSHPLGCAPARRRPQGGNPRQG